MPEPYPVTVADGIFRFTTAHDIQYSARFLEMPLPANVQLAGLIFDFSFFPDEPVAGPEDARVAATLFYLVKRFFETQQEYILLYICESSDERHFFRQRLFTRWRLANDHAGQFRQLPIEITRVEPAIIGGLLFRQDHPLQTELAAFLTSGDSGLYRGKRRVVSRNYLRPTARVAHLTTRLPLKRRSPRCGNTGGFEK